MIDCTPNGEVMELRLAHAPLNEIGTEVLAALEHALDEIERARPRALVVYSAQPRGFCAGADLRELYFAVRGRDKASYRDELSSFLDRVHAVMNRFDALPLATIGALHGVCFGGGFELALSLDVLIADVSARFCFPELRLGLIPGFGGLPRLRRELPNAVMRDLLLTGRSLNAKRAAALGLVAQVVAPGAALEVARETAQQSARFDPEVVGVAKRFIKPLPLEELAEEKRLFIELFGAPRVLEALRRFVESEDPMPYLPERTP